MSETPKTPDHGQALNPALRQRRGEDAYDTTRSTPAPVDSASVQRQEGRAWPTIWLIVTILCVLLGIYLIFF